MNWFELTPDDQFRECHDAAAAVIRRRGLTDRFEPGDFVGDMWSRFNAWQARRPELLLATHQRRAFLQTIVVNLVIEYRTESLPQKPLPDNLAVHDPDDEIPVENASAESWLTSLATSLCPSLAILIYIFVDFQLDITDPDDRETARRYLLMPRKRFRVYLAKIVSRAKRLVALGGLWGKETR
jgi:hypothetical protein